MAFFGSFVRLFILGFFDDLFLLFILNSILQYCENLSCHWKKNGVSSYLQRKAEIVDFKVARGHNTRRI